MSYSRYDVEAEKAIVDLLKQTKVAFKSEIRYRLEKRFPYHTVTDYAVDRLAKGVSYTGLSIIRQGLPGRPKIRVPREAKAFFHLPGISYREVLPLMRQKALLSAFISSVASHAGFWAQELWKRAFESLGYNVVSDQDVREFRGKTTSINNTIDFIVEKKGVLFGVEVKNDLTHPTDLDKKFQVAVELDVIPVFVVRHVTPTAYKNIKRYGGLVKIYETSIFPTAYIETVDKCRRVLGYPIIALDEISEKTKLHLENKVMPDGFSDPDRLKGLNRQFLQEIKSYKQRLERLGRELTFR
jgi:hypothetical protein